MFDCQVFAFHSLRDLLAFTIDNMDARFLGTNRLEVSALGLGCWGFSDAYGKADRAESIAVIHEALGSGINFFDTADVYGAGGNEILLGEALKGRRHDALIATKFGFRGNEHGEWEVCGRPAYVKQACDASLLRLRIDHLDLYYQHRVDKRVPIEETAGAMAELVAAGKVRHIGLSEASAETIARAHAVHRVTAVQSEYSLVTRGIENRVLPACRRLGIAVVAFSPLGRGLLGAKVRRSGDMAPDDYRKNLPRFEDQNLERNLALLEPLEKIARAHGATTAQIALAWLLQQGADILPIPGTRTRKHLRENVAATRIVLTPGELAIAGELAAKVQGERHNARNLGFLDA